MANKADRFFFENLVQSADYACKAAAYLVECMNNYNNDNIEEMLKKMHEIEHEGDTKKHEMSVALAKAFVTPVDREDLAVISQNIDEVTDSIEEVLQRFYVDEIKVITSDAIEFASRIAASCEMMKNMLVEFPRFKKPEKLHKMVVELNHMEESCDKLYLDATLHLRKEFTDVLDIISWREIYDYMEKCADACEHVGDCVEVVIMKNT